MNRCSASVLFLLTVLLAFAAVARADWSAELLGGGAWNAHNDLHITQEGQPDLVFPAAFETRPFEQPLYWALRLNLHRGDRLWSLELNHHKLILTEGPPEVTGFSVTHGTNILSVQHAWLRPRWRAMVQAGVVVAHPESTVRGLRFDESGGMFGAGYHVAGPAVGVGVGSHLALTDWLGLNAEMRLTAAWLDLGVAQGSANHTNVALHVLLGPRVRF